jgi:O-antigen/teichoic acid export membrane protein
LDAAKRVAKNTGILYARMAITVFMSLYSTRLILAALGVEDFGLFSLVGGVISMLGFLNNAMSTATQRFVSLAQGAGDLEMVKRIFNMSSLLHWGVAVLVLFLLEGAGYFLFNGFLNIPANRISDAYLIYHFMVASTLFTVISVPYEAIITSHENMFIYAVLGVIEAILKLGIALYITYHSVSDHLIVYGFLMTSLSVFMLIIRRIYCQIVYPECDLKIRLYFDRSLLVEISLFAGLSFLGAFSSMMSNYGQSVLLNLFFGTGIIAAQNIGSQLGGQLSVFSSTLSKALNPVISKFEGAGERKKMMKALFFGSKVTFLLQAIFFLPFIIEMPIILHYWIKDVPEYTVIFCRMILINNLIGALSTNLSNAISAVGNIRNFEIISSILNVTSLSLSYLFFNMGSPPYYLYFSLILITCMHVLNNIIFSHWNFQLSLKQYLNEVVFKVVLISLITVIFALGPLLIFSNQLLSLVSVFIISGITFLAGCWFIGLTKDEREMVVNIKVKFQLEITRIFQQATFFLNSNK